MHRFRAPIHRSRGLATAALVAAIFGSCTPSPNASATPDMTAPPTVAATAAVSTAASPTATAAPRPSAAAPVSDRYGLIVDLRPPLLGELLYGATKRGSPELVANTLLGAPPRPASMRAQRTG